MIVQLYVMGALHPLDITGCNTVKDIKVLISRKVTCQLIRSHTFSIRFLCPISNLYIKITSWMTRVSYFLLLLASRRFRIFQLVMMILFSLNPYRNVYLYTWFDSSFFRECFFNATIHSGRWNYENVSWGQFIPRWSKARDFRLVVAEIDVSRPFQSYYGGRFKAGPPVCAWMAVCDV